MTSRSTKRLSGSERYYDQLYSEYSDAEAAQCKSRRGCNKRRDYLSWEKFFMCVARLTEMRSKDPETRVGACIVNQEHKIVGIGHNELPTGCDEDDFEFWSKKDVSKDGFENTKYAFVCHAAVNAILNKNAESLVGCTLYTTLFPAHEDAKMIIQSGIREVVYFDDKHHDKTYTKIARKLLTKAKVWYTSYHDFPKSITKPNDDVTVYPLPDCPRSTSTAKLLREDKEYFMALACLAAQRSKDPARQVGACIVNEAGKIVGIGYNGFPRGISDDDPQMSWGKSKNAHPIDTKYPYAVHAEVNAIMYKTCISLEGCSLYTTLFPCNECVKVIIQAGIKTIYYLRGEDDDKKCYVRASKKLLELADYSDPFCSKMPPRRSKRKRVLADSEVDQNMPGPSKHSRPIVVGVKKKQAKKKKCLKYPVQNEIVIKFSERRSSQRRK